ncbi:MAG: M6 family metalloprotease domain-containing protein, partial [Bacteroidales bacterium]|nr:M6 family metalloprotease domain-containing protein [Bacteroidales bacterium]
MKFKPVLTAIALLCICTALSAVPAKRGILRLAQPDGSVLRVRIIGDEFSHIIRTEDGATLKLGPDGFYKYGVIGQNGKLTATEYTAGKEVPGQVLQESRAVPLSFVTRTGRENRQRLAMRAKSALRYEEEAQEEKGDTQEDDGDAIKKVLVLPVQFQDLNFTKQRSDFETLMAKAMGYYQDQLQGKYQIAFDVAGIVTVSKGYAYYGEDGDDGLDLRPAEAVQEAVAELDPDVDFSSYDFLYMFYAGGSPGDGGADDDHIWPHRMSDVSIRTQEKTFNSYACSSEMMVSNSTGRLIFTGIGMFCHEFGHELGLKDMYDTDYEQSGGSAEGLWHTTSIMDGGCYNNNSNTPPCLNAIELDQLGIVEPETLAIGDYVLQPISEQKRFLRMDTDNPGEYFLFECRAATGWDQYMGTLDGLSGSGLLIYHVDRSQNDAGYSQIQDRNLTASQRWIFNEVNNNPSYQCADLLEAYPLATTITEIFYPY